MPAHFENGEKCDSYAKFELAFTRYRHIFCQHILKTVDFENGTLTGTFWKRHRVNASSNFGYRHIFHRFKNVPASCERSLRYSFSLLDFSFIPFLPTHRYSRWTSYSLRCFLAYVATSCLQRILIGMVRVGREVGSPQNLIKTRTGFK